MFTIDNSKAKSTLQQHWILKDTLIVHLIDVDQSSRSVIYDLRGRGESWWWSLHYEMAKVTSQAQGSWQTEVGWWSRTHALPDAQSLLIWVLLWPSGKAWNGTKVHGVQKPEQELSNFEHWKTPWFAQLLRIRKPCSSSRRHAEAQKQRQRKKDSPCNPDIILKWWNRVNFPPIFNCVTCLLCIVSQLVQLLLLSISIFDPVLKTQFDLKRSTTPIVAFHPPPSSNSRDRK